MTDRLPRCTYPGCAWRWRSGDDRFCADHQPPRSLSLRDHLLAELRGDVADQDGAQFDGDLTHRTVT
jgi:hypothetical protein